MQIFQEWPGDPWWLLTGKADTLTTFQISGYVPEHPELYPEGVEVSSKTQSRQLD